MKQSTYDLLVAGIRGRRNYDGNIITVRAEIWAEEHLKMVKAPKGAKGFDGTLAGQTVTS
ncbi:MAG: hypothetical protein OXE94_13735 [Aestuariivita sp.]|nr:hypothetical protein [Aestuariivita sp.]MCY4203002.1 hypothetical protein [Aestuariivita sp.]